MEHFYLSLVLLFVSVISLSLFILFYRHRSPFTAPNLPPGKIGYPLIGESLEYLSTGWQGHPEKFIFDRTTKYKSDIFKTSILGEPAAVFCGAACNKFLFSNEDKLVISWWPDSVNKVFASTHLIDSQEEAKKMRRMVSRFSSLNLSKAILESWTPLPVPT